MNRLRLMIGSTGLHYDRNYAGNRVSGWTAVHNGSVLWQPFVSLPRAIITLIKSILRNEN
jgi:hypothetical protein